MPSADPWHEQDARAEKALAAGTLKLVFVLGMARSGTTWLLELLKQHPAVAALDETELFSKYLAGVQRAQDELVPRHKGLSCLLPAEEERRAWRALVLRLLLAGLPDWPTRRVVVEKTPAHTRSARFIHVLLPEAYFLHLVRDPRDVAASRKAAGLTWASDRDWAQQGRIWVAGSWTKDVRAGLRLAGDTERHRLVRYEDLRADGPATLSSLFDWLGLDATAATVEEYLARCSLENMRSGGWPEGFFRGGLVNGWRDDLSRREVARIERVAGPVMDELGYARSSGHRRLLPSLWLYRAAGRLERTSARIAARLRL